MLPDVLQPGLRIVFCGTAVGTRSAAVSAYYAGAGSKFWRILYSTGLTPRLLVPEEYTLLPKFGLGLTDLVKSKGGCDSSLINSDFMPGSLLEKVKLFAPRIMCFNGKQAAKRAFHREEIAYGFLADTFGSTKFFVAPSTSGAANGWWEDCPWKELADAASTA